MSLRLTGYDPYVDFLNTARQTLPVLCLKDDVFMLEDGTLVSDISGEQSRHTPKNRLDGSITDI